MIMGILVSGVGVVSAATLTVDSSQATDATSDRYATISEAVNAASDGDVVELANNNYTLNSEVVVDTNNLTVRSEDATKVTLNVSNVSSGQAFNTSNVTSFTIGQNVKLEGGSTSFFGSGISENSDLVMLGGIAVVLLGGYYVVKEQ